MQAPLQGRRFAAQVVAQLPPEQTSPLAQTEPASAPLQPALAPQ